jgi:hypothetical protein
MSGVGSITVRVPLAIRPRPGRKTIVRAAGSGPSASIATRADPAMVKALARAFRWNRLLDNGRYASISEIAAAEKIDRGYIGSILRLTLLAPDIVEVILDGRQPEELGLPALLEPFPIEWGQQRSWFAAVVSPRKATGNEITASQSAAGTGRRHQRNRRTSATEARNAVP